jgi:RNA polymerase sigma-70 factor (ECF subfamily)
MENDAQFRLWLDAARRGDVEAFGRVVGLLRPRMARIVARYARAEADREDLLQDVFIRAFRSLKKFRGRGSFEGWMRKIAVRTCIDWLRVKLRRREISESELTQEENHWLQRRFSGGEGDSPDDEMEKNMARDILYRALDELTVEDRTAIVLFEIEGLSVAEVSEITGWSESNVKVRCHRARKRLAAWIRERGENQ